MQKHSGFIAVVTTGGTIDKAYFDALSSYRVGEPCVEKILETAKVACPYRVVELMRKDSLELGDQDRAQLRDTIEGLPTRRIVVTHGTDTMTLSASALAPLSGRTIVLTGALSPARFVHSDAAFNLGMAFAAVQVLPAGVYVAMNGQVFAGDQVRKDRARGCFVPLNPVPRPGASVGGPVRD